MPKKRRSVGYTIGGIVAGIEQQIFKTTPPANELVAKGTPLRPVAAAGGGTITVGMPGDGVASPLDADQPNELRLQAPGVSVVIDLVAGGRIASFVVNGHELLVTEGYGPIAWGSFPMAPFAGRVRDGRFAFRGRDYQLPIEMPPHAIHGTVLARRWRTLDDVSITTDLGPGWPFAGRAVQRFELSDGRLTFRLEIQADEPMPASIGWHPWFRRVPSRVPGADAAVPRATPPVVLDLDAAAMIRRDAAGIATAELAIPPPAGPWDDAFIDLRQPPRLRWPGFLELTIESDCPIWVVYTVPDEAICVEPQTAPPDALNNRPAIVEPGRPLVAEMTWSWRSLAD